METQRQYYRGSTFAIALLLMLPLLGPDFAIASICYFSPGVGEIFEMHGISWLRFALIGGFVAQFGLVYLLALISDWILDKSGKRHWLRFKLSTCMIAVVILSLITGAMVRQIPAQSTWKQIEAVAAIFSVVSFFVVMAFGLAILGATAEIYYPGIAINLIGPSATSVTSPTPITRMEIPSFRERVLGSILLCLLIVCAFAATPMIESMRGFYMAMRIDLPLPTVIVLRFGGFVIHQTLSWLLLATVLFWFYWIWVSHSQRRIFRFNLFIILLLLLGVVVMMFSFVLPFFQYNNPRKK